MCLTGLACISSEQKIAFCCHRGFIIKPQKTFEIVVIGNIEFMFNVFNMFTQQAHNVETVD